MQRCLFRLLTICCIGQSLLTLANAETRAYIPDLGGNRIVRIAADASFQSVSLGGSPYGIAVTPDGRRILVTRTAAATLTVIADETFATAESQIHIAVGAAPRGVAVTPNGQYAFVSNYDDGSVSQISLSSLAVVDTIEVGNGPWGVAAFYDASAATHRVYVANHLDDSLSVITRDGTKTIANVGNGPVGVSLTPDGRWLYVANYNDDTVAVIRTSNDSLFDIVSVGDGPFGVAVGLRGEAVFVSNSFSDSVSVIRVSDNRIEQVYRVGNQPMGVAAPANGAFAYVVNALSNSVTRIDHTDRVVESLLAGELNGAVALGAFFGGRLPGAPGNLVAETESSGRIALSWTDNSDDELGFIVERRRATNDEFDEITRVAANHPTFLDGNLQSETTYVYRVRAFNETGFSAYSGTAEATTDDSHFSWSCFIGTLLH